MGTFPVDVAGLHSAEVSVFAHVGFAVETLVDETVAIIVLAVALFDLALGDAPEHRVAARRWLTVELGRTRRNAGDGTELRVRCVAGAQTAVAVLARRAGRAK